MEVKTISLSEGQDVTPTPVANALGYALKTGAYTTVATDEAIAGDPSSGDFTITLVTAVSNQGVRQKFANIAENGYVTIDANGSETIGGRLTIKLGPGEKLEIVSDNSNWQISNVVVLQDNVNLIHNSDFLIAERGTSFVGTSNGYTLDRFATREAGTSAVHDVNQSTSVPTHAQAGFNFKNSFEVDFTTADASVDAGDYLVIEHRILGYDFAYIHQGVATLSFWVYATKTGTSCVAFQNSAGNRSYIAEFTINTTNTWEFKVVTLQMDTSGTWLIANNLGLKVFFTLMAGSTYQATADSWQAGNFLGTSNQVNHADNASNYYRITGLHLRPGPYITPYLRAGKTLSGEDLLCKNFYRELRFMRMHAISTSTCETSLYWPDMRTSPTASLGGTMNISDGVNPGATQSSSQISNIATQKNGGRYNFGNFSGLTQYRTYVTTSSSNKLQLTADL